MTKDTLDETISCIDYEPDSVSSPHGQRLHLHPEGCNHNVFPAVGVLQ